MWLREYLREMYRKNYLHHLPQTNFRFFNCPVNIKLYCQVWGEDKTSKVGQRQIDESGEHIGYQWRRKDQDDGRVSTPCHISIDEWVGRHDSQHYFLKDALI